jgi:hypothetical protein
VAGPASAPSIVEAGIAYVGVAREPADQVFAQAVADTAHASSYRMLGALGTPEQSLAIDASVTSRRRGQVTLQQGDQTVTLIRLGGTVYLDGNEGFWIMNGGTSAVQSYAGRWVRTPASSSAIRPFLAFMDAGQLARQLFATVGAGGFVKEGTSRVGGRPALTITGTIGGSHAQIAVATAGTAYILQVSTTESGQPTGMLTFGDYRKHLRLVAPKGAVPYQPADSPPP